MNLRTTALIAALLVGGSALAGYAKAQTASDNGNVAIIVNGHKITADEVALAIDDILPQISEVPPNLRYAFVVEYLVERHLLAQEAVRLQLIESDAYLKRIRFYQAKALRDALFKLEIAPKVTDKLIEETYNEHRDKVLNAPGQRVHARHIVVKTEAEIQAISSQLATGAEFQELAKQHNIDGSGPFGGDLGLFARNEMVPAFSNAAFNLKRGQVSEPVKTDDGWHIIKLEDVQKNKPQPIERVREPIKRLLQRQAVQDEVNRLREDGDIKLIDPDLAKLQSLVKEQRRKLNKNELAPGGGNSNKQ